MSIDIKSIKTKEALHAYYDKVLEREQKTRELRENVNNFFLSASSLVFSVAAFMANKAGDTNAVFIISVNSMGALFAVLWLQSLSRYKLELSHVYQAIQKFEVELNINIFSESLSPVHGKKVKQSVEFDGNLTTSEMAVPSLFLLGYISYVVAYLWRVL